MSIPASTILKELRDFIAKHPNAAKAAKALKVTPSQLSLALNGKSKIIPEKILSKLGYKTQLIYTRKDGKHVKQHINRDAGTGKIVSPDYAKANPDTTVRETIVVPGITSAESARAVAHKQTQAVTKRIVNPDAVINVREKS